MNTSKLSIFHGIVVLRALLIVFAAAAVPVRAAESNAIYDRNCALCHQKGGTGLLGQFPRLAGRVGEIAKQDAGRRYLVQALVYGMAGKIEVDGTVIVGVMPSFASLSDEEIASVLSFVAQLNGPAKTASTSERIDASLVKAVRAGAQLSPSQVHESRQSVVQTKTAR